MLKPIKGIVAHLRHRSKDRGEEDKANLSAGKQYEKVTTYTTMFNLDATEVRLSTRCRKPELYEGDERVVAGFMLVGESRCINYKNLSTERFDDRTLSATLFISITMIIAGFFVTPETLGQFDSAFRMDNFAPSITFIKWVFLRFTGTIFFFISLKDTLASLQLRNLQFDLLRKVYS